MKLNQVCFILCNGRMLVGCFLKNEQCTDAAKKRYFGNRNKDKLSFLCHSLQTLSLDGNLLSSLPDELGGLAQLNSLGLSFNSFSHIPAVLERLSAVDKLAMAGNRVESLDLGALARMSHLKNIDLR